MIRFDSGGVLLERASELPQVPAVIPRLFADFETSSGHYQKKSVNPWRDCMTIGAAVSFEEDLAAPTWFVPRELLATGWWRDVVKATKKWTNHNIKYDVHVSHNDLKVTANCELDCTLNSSKLIDSDRVYKGGYGLDFLSKDWLDTNIDQFGIAMLPWLDGNQDYGRVPLDILAEYACVDVITNKRLAKYIDERMPDESRSVWATERAFTSLLVRMERRGVRVDPQKVKITRARTLHKLIEIDAKLHEMVGFPFRPYVRDDCYDVLINTFGLPILGWTNPLNESDDDDGDDDGYVESKVPGASFDKATMKKYLTYPGAPKDLIQLMLDYRKLNTFESLFLSKWLELADKDGVLHATYNQSVRTGRMSCSKPNFQQLSGVAKELIEPPPGYVLVCTDACVPGHVKVITPYGERCMSEVVEKKLAVLGYDDNASSDRRLKFCDVSDAAYIRDDNVYRVNLENGQSIECTADHGFIRLDGQRINCIDLVPGDRLKHVGVMKNFSYPQWRVDDTFIPKHICAGKWLHGEREGYQYHHIDEDKDNWCADNIELKEEHAHKRDHGVTNYARQDHTKRLEKLRASMQYRDLSGENNGRWTGGKEICYCEVCGEFTGYHWPSQRKKRCRSHLKSRWGDKWAHLVEPENHKVASVEYVGVMPVYSLTNPTTHNYVTSEGLINLNSQIEYRFISHYIQSKRIIEAYRLNPWEDFHEWVAELVPTKRKPAKTLNFMMGYGGGKKKTIEMLAINEDFVKDVIAEVDASGLTGADREMAVKAATRARAEGVYARYHQAMPELKTTSKFASGRCVKNGYVRNHYGRRRHLPEKAAHVAFNSINQSSAGDLVKERMVALEYEVPELIQIAQVHDEILGLLPEELVRDDDRVLRKIVSVLNDPMRPLTVPVRWSIGYSRNNWAEAKGDDAERKYFWVSSIYDRLGWPRPSY